MVRLEASRRCVVTRRSQYDRILQVGFFAFRYGGHLRDCKCPLSCLAVAECRYRDICPTSVYCSCQSSAEAVFCVSTQRLTALNRFYRYYDYHLMLRTLHRLRTRRFGRT